MWSCLNIWLIKLVKKYDIDIDNILNTKDLKSNTMKLPYYIIINIILPMKQDINDKNGLNGMQRKLVIIMNKY